MTIPLLEVSFTGIFEFGQAYVALSRAVDLVGLSLNNFQPDRIKAHDKVVNFYDLMTQQLSSSSKSLAAGPEYVDISLNELAKSFESKRAKSKDAKEKTGGNDGEWYVSKRAPAVTSARQAPGQQCEIIYDYLSGCYLHNPLFIDCPGEYEYDEWLEVKVPKAVPSSSQKSTFSNARPGITYDR